MQLSEKPKTLFCYICGREFGTTSLSIHLKSCTKKFENQQSKKQPKDRINLPEIPQELDLILSGKADGNLIQMYNKKAINTHKYQVLPKCRFCDRTFNEDSLKAHQNGCSKKNSQKVQQKGYQLPDAFKKPRTLTCCICGRDFGLTSLKIHYPQCLDKFKNDELKKPKPQRREPPQFSQEKLELINNKEDWTLQEIDQFNNKANDQYRDKAMVQCQNCGRKFLQSSYQKHRKNCELINGKKQNKESSGKDSQQSHSVDFRSTQSQFKKPRTLTCCVCGRDFGLTSLKIHYPQCVEKFKTDELKKPKAERKQPPQFSEQKLELINNKEDWTLQQIEQFNNKANNDYRDKAMVQCQNCGRKFIEASYLKHKKNCTLINGVNKSNSSASLAKEKQSSSSDAKFRPSSPEFKKPRTLTCCVCGRDFGLTSLKIHYPQCLEKFAIDEAKKSKSERKVPPQFSQVQLQMINNKTDWTLEQIDSFNNRANSHYRDKAMVQCENCGRKFIETSYAKHKKNCQLINGKKQNSGSTSGSKLQPSYMQAPQAKKPKVLMCHICGREFGLTSLIIHHPQCQQKFLNNEKKKPKQQRRPLPVFTEDKLISFSLNQAASWPMQKIEQYNKIANQVYRAQSLCPCPICGRKFFEESLPKHLKFCAKNKQKADSQQKNVLSNSVDKKNDITQNPSLVKKSSTQSANLERNFSQKIQQLPEQHHESHQNTPSKQNNSSFLKSQLYNKMSSSTENVNTFQDNISEVDQSMQQTLKEEKPNIFTQSKHPDQSEVLQSQSKLQAEQKNIELSEEKNPQKDKSLSQFNSAKLQKSIVNQSQILQSQQEENKFPKQVLSPTAKAQSSKGFAAPRKKQESMQANMKQCKHCNRKFDEDRIQKHQKACFDSKQRQRKSQKVISSETKIQQSSTQNQFIPPKNQVHQEKIRERDVLSPQDKIRMKKGFAAPRQKQSEIQAKMIECKGCKRKFVQDRIQKHQSICKQAQQLNKQLIVAGSYKKIEQNNAEPEKVSIKRVQCPKCSRKFAEDRLDKHVQICKAVAPGSQNSLSSNKDIKSSNSNKEKDKIVDVIKPEMEKQAFQSINLQPCDKCGRKFNSDRLTKHKQVCKGTNNQSQTQNANAAFKKQKEVTVPKKQYDLAKLEIKDQTQEDNRAECPKCLRKFVVDRLEKHVNTCKAVPPLSNLDIKSKIVPKLELNPVKQPNNKIKFQTPKGQQKITKSIGEDQYIEQQLFQCDKCSRKFVKQRLQKHIQICKGSNKLKVIADRPENVTEMSRKKPGINQDQLRKTKDQFFNMVKDIKGKKVRDQEIEKQLDNELLDIQATHKISRKQNLNFRQSSQKKKTKDSMGKSVNLPKI